MKVFLDDEREPVDDTWVIVRSVETCLQLLITGRVTHLSLDHDLGENKKTGYDVLKCIEEQMVYQGFNPPKIAVHSMNPVGRDRMLASITWIEDNKERFVS